MQFQQIFIVNLILSFLDTFLRYTSICEDEELKLVSYLLSVASYISLLKRIKDLLPCLKIK